MQIPKTFLAACAAASILASVPICNADDSATTNAPAATEIKTNDTQSAQSKPLTKAEKKKLAEEKKKADQAAKKQAEADAKAQKAGGKTNTVSVATQPTAPKNTLGLPPIPAPPLPISADKQQRLKELLQKYRADQITPEQYHTERAKILAEQ